MPNGKHALWTSAFALTGAAAAMVIPLAAMTPSAKASKYYVPQSIPGPRQQPLSVEHLG